MPSSRLIRCASRCGPATNRPTVAFDISSSPSQTGPSKWSDRQSCIAGADERGLGLHSPWHRSARRTPRGGWGGGRRRPAGPGTVPSKRRAWEGCPPNEMGPRSPTRDHGGARFSRPPWAASANYNAASRSSAGPSAGDRPCTSSAPHRVLPRSRGPPRYQRRRDRAAVRVRFRRCRSTLGRTSTPCLRDRPPRFAAHRRRRRISLWSAVPAFAASVSPAVVLT